ncbi:hypothetical protein PLESTB_001747600 [Pleodorina starrii]|uniref:Uncharacterized protein n=1 Tax=Pleodorina starrii TaxID=330485 RepID=A0A9W6F9G3_9CHLO|nr:hypothetical protein PLESTM_001671700 [Pleodorina starrii]GLC61362.1 hypothetical protein PLESTB_001747600 [Pleodorina starrii]GLC69327.1 hypothetical protein PLESTF_000817300 [Pleodorina starrii]
MYGDDDSAALLLATSTQPDEGACCQACYANPICIHWDFELGGSRACRLWRDRAANTVSASSLLRVQQNDGRVAGSRNGVSTYVNHPRYYSAAAVSAAAAAAGSFNTAADDNGARWISSMPTAFVPFGNRVAASAWAYTTFYKTFFVPPVGTTAADDDPITATAQPQQQQLMNVTITVIADDEAVVFVNGQQIGQTTGSLVQTALQLTLQAGPRHLLVLQCKGTGGPAVVVAKVVGLEGSLLAYTDHTWMWL